MAAPPLRALVLAAGLGTRLRPLTASCPKPLLPVAGTPLLAHTLARLAEVGCEAVAINLHHLGEAIRGHFGDRFCGMELRYSPEPEILGTLGALGPLREFLGAAPSFLVINGDSLCDWPLAELLEAHGRAGTLATLLVSSRAEPSSFGGGIGLGEGGRVVRFTATGPVVGRAERERVFAGAHAMRRELLAGLPPGPADTVRQLYEPMLAAGLPIASLETDRPWFDLGTPVRYLEAVLGWTGVAASQRSWLDPGAEVAVSAELSGSVIEAGAEVGAHSRVARSLLLRGARVGAGARVSGSILGFGVEIPPGTETESELVTRGEQPGELVRTEIEP